MQNARYIKPKVRDGSSEDQSKSQKTHKRLKSEYYTDGTVRKCIARTDVAKLKSFLNDKTSWAKIPHCTKTEINRPSRWYTGRYCKFSRNLPQTPWNILNDDGSIASKKTETCVQDLLEKPLNNFINAEKVNLASSGREDVDVRMLGNGRPFVLEFINPRLRFSEVDIEKVNADYEKSKLVSVKNLQICDKQAHEQMLVGAEEKKKHYRALCFLEVEKLETSQIEKIETVIKNFEKLEDMTLKQETPLRVTHRRTLAVRERMVYSCEIGFVERRDNFFWFTIDIETQAGTY